MIAFRRALLFVDKTGKSVRPFCTLNTLLLGSEKPRSCEVTVESDFGIGLVGYWFTSFAEEELDWKVVFGGGSGRVSRCEMGYSSERMEFSNRRS